MRSFDGIICVDKPEGFTSFDVIAKLRGATRTKKIGHAGTLDPVATGVLPVFFGRAAKAIGLLPNHDKAYEAWLRLGVTTDTQDITGTVLSQTPHAVSASGVESALKAFEGDILQTPPMYSAVRVNGKRLYDIARKGGSVDIKPRGVTVYSVSLLDADENAGLYKIGVSCSGGTYIRTICHDLGRALGCGAVMTALRRTSACGFTLPDCFSLSEIQALAGQGVLADKLLPVSSVFPGLRELVLDGTQAKRFCNGLELGLNQFGGLPENGARLRVLDSKSRFLGIAEIDTQNSKLKIIKLFMLEENL